MKTSATTTALHNAVAGSVSRAGVWSRARSVLLRSVAACLAVVAVQQAASAQWVSGTMSGTYQWADTANWVGGTITNTISASSTATGNLTFQFSTGSTFSTRIFPNFSTAPSGTLRIVTFGATSGTQTLNFNNGTGFAFNGNSSNGNNFQSNLILNLVGGTVTFDSSNQRNTTVDSQITGAGSLSTGINGRIILTNTANNFTGNLIVSRAGNSADALRVSPNTYGTPSQLIMNGGLANPPQLELNASGTYFFNSPSGTGTIYNVSSTSSSVFAAVSNVNSTFTLASQPSNTGIVSLAKFGSGTLTLTGTTNYSGPTVLEAGVLNIRSIANASGSSTLGASGNAATNLVFRGGQLRYSGSSSGSTNRLFSIGTGGGGIIADGTTGFLSFIGGGTIATPGNGNRVFTLSGSNTGTNTLTTALANGSGGSTSLVKSGVGRWVLGGIHTYTGSTSIDGGSLLVNGTLGNTAVTVNSSGLLGGSGRIDGSVSVLSGGTFSPGTSPGLLTLGSSLTLAGTTLMEIDGTTRGSLYDGADVGGALTYGGAMSIVFNSSLTSAYADQTEFNFFDFASQSGSFTSITTQSNGAYYGGLTFTQSGTKWTATKTSGSQTQTLEFTPSTGNLVIVPEPLTLGLLGIGSGVAVLGLRRLRRRSGGRSDAT